MDPIDVKPILERLEENFDDLEEALEPLLKSATSNIASKLPLLDKAKAYVLTAYAIESLLFSSLQLNGVKAKDHAIFTELTRLKQYFAKIKEAETGPKQRTLTVDKAAAGRFIKHALSGNDRYDSDKYNRMMKEKANAESQKTGHIKFNEAAEHLKQEQISTKRKTIEGDVLVNEEEDDSDSESDSSEPEPTTLLAESGNDSTDRSAMQEAEFTTEDFMELDQDSKDQRKKEKKQKKREKQRQKKRKRYDDDAGEEEHVTTMDEANQSGKKKRRSIGQESRNQSPIVRRSGKKPKQDKGKAPESIIPQKTKSNVVPKGHSEAFQALLKGPIQKPERGSKKSKRKS